LSVKSNEENSVDELKRHELPAEFQRMQKSIHRLINYLAAISGYAQIVQFRPERPAAELHKIIHTVEKSMVVLRAFVANLQECERRYS